MTLLFLLFLPYLNKHIRFLTKIRWIKGVGYADKAAQSKYQWRETTPYGIDWVTQTVNPHNGIKIYTLSYLGVINGYLPKMKMVLVVNENNTLEIVRKWW